MGEVKSLNVSSDSSNKIDNTNVQSTATAIQDAVGQVAEAMDYLSSITDSEGNKVESMALDSLASDKKYTHDDDGNPTGYFFGDSNLYYDMINDTYKRYNEENCNFENISIYDQENIDSNQYGARQDNFIENFDELIQDEYIKNELEKWFPKDSFDSEGDASDFYERYLDKLANVGCGYAAATNIIFKEFEGREKEFEETFGFPMYTVNDEGQIDFNYEYMMLTIFDYTWAREYSGEDIINDKVKKEFFEVSPSVAYDLELLEDFLKEYGIDCTSKTDWHNRFAYWDSDESIENEIKGLNENNEYVVYGGEGYDLYDMDGNRIVEKGGAHYLLITGYTDDNKPIVTSWGRQYILDIKSDDLHLFEEDKYRYTTIKFNKE